MQRVERIGDLYVAFFPLYDCGTQRMNHSSLGQS